MRYLQRTSTRAGAKPCATMYAVPKNRLEAFADGIFAVAATLLILDISVNGHPLGQQLLDHWPSYAAYAISFVTIGIIWTNHHLVMHQLAHVDRFFLIASIL